MTDQTIDRVVATARAEVRRQVAEEIARAIELKRDQRSYHETVGEWSEVSHGGVLLGLREAAQIAREIGTRGPQ